MVIKELNLEVEYKHVDVLNKEQFHPDYIKVSLIT